MANIYVRSTDGNNADSGATWALAKADVSGASAIDAAGDFVFLSQNHAESVASSSNAWAGTVANPVFVVGGNDAAEPPTALSTAPTITVTGTTFSWGGSVRAYGIGFRFSSASSAAYTFNGTSAASQIFENCSLWITGAAGSSQITIGATSAGNHSYTELSGCTLRLAGAGQSVSISREVIIKGGSWASGGTSPTGVFSIGDSTRATKLLVQGFDFSALSSSVNIVKALGEGGVVAVFRNCKLPASWSGALVTSGQTKLGARVEMHNCDNTDTNYRIWVEDYAGSIKSETTIVRTGGASDGVTSLSWKMASSANTHYGVGGLASPEIVKWNETTGSSITATVEIVTDNVTLKDDECWLEIQYLGTSGFPLSLFSVDAKADVLATAVAQTTSTETWTTTGLATPVKQKLSVSFTPQEKGYVHAVVKLAKPSATVYVDPLLTIA